MAHYRFVPQVNKFDFYSQLSNGYSLVQLVAEAKETFVPNNLSILQVSKIIRRAKLCELLTSIEFTIDSYGLINYYLDSKPGELVNFEYLKYLLSEYDDAESIDFIEKSFTFYKTYEQDLEELRSSGGNFESIYDRLNSLIDFNNTLYISLQKLERTIQNNPDDFCFDEDGNSINPNFSGNLKKFYTNGNIARDYHFQNGKFHGEALDYNKEGKKIQLKLFEDGKLVKILENFETN